MEIDGIKSMPFKVKAAGPADGLNEGQFVAYCSVFGNKDSYGDIVDPGAFTRTLDEWQSKGATIPVIWGHDMEDAFATIGGVEAAEQDDTGLKVTCTLDLDNPTGAQVYRLVKGRRVNTMSFAYGVRDAQEADDGYHLKDLDLYEVSVVHVPANPMAEILAVKSATAALLKAGRTLSAKNETSLRDARDAIDSVLASLDAQGGKTGQSSGDAQEKASGTTEVKTDASDEEPSQAKSNPSAEEPKSNPSAESLAAIFTYAKVFLAEGSPEE